MTRSRKLIHPWLNLNDKRQAWFLAFVGVNGTGKSTLMRKFINMNDRNLVLPSNMIEATKSWGNFPKVKPTHSFESDPYDPKQNRQLLVFKTPGIRTMTGTKLVDVGVFREGEHKRAYFSSIADVNRRENCFTNGGLFIDDTRNYIITKGDLPNKVTTFLINRRHLSLDIFLAFHSFQDVNAQMLQYGLKFILFKTDLPPNDTVKEKIQCIDDLIEMRAYVNEKARTNPYYYEAFDPTNKEANEIWRKKFRN